MRANPGGEIPPEEVVGRDDLIRRIWRILERQSLVLQAERRMGKSCVIKKMTARPRPGFLALYRDLEGVKAPLEFVETVFRDVERHLSRLGKIAGKARNLAHKLRGVQLGKVKFPRELAPNWKLLLEATLRDLVTQQEDRLVLFWDEIPYMLQNIQAREGESQAVDLLDNLRALRQTLPEIRMVFTGSIGLHHVLSSLRGDLSHAPTNDMYVLEVPPLEEADAAGLALALLEGEGIRCSDPRGTALAVARGVDGVPFYIHHLVDRLAALSGPVGPADVEALIEENLTHPTDPWHMGHYRERLRVYYGDREPLALEILDTLAARPGGVSFDELTALLQATPAHPGPEEVRTMLADLARDHYVTGKRGIYTFLFPMIRRWWRLARDL